MVEGAKKERGTDVLERDFRVTRHGKNTLGNAHTKTDSPRKKIAQNPKKKRSILDGPTGRKRRSQLCSGGKNLGENPEKKHFSRLNTGLGNGSSFIKKSRVCETPSISGPEKNESPASRILQPLPVHLLMTDGN